MNNVTSVCVFLEPMEHSMRQLLIWIRLHYLWLKVRGLKAFPVQIGLLIHGTSTFTQGLLLGGTQKCDLRMGKSS